METKGARTIRKRMKSYLKNHDTKWDLINHIKIYDYTKWEPRVQEPYENI